MIKPLFTACALGAAAGILWGGDKPCYGQPSCELPQNYSTCAPLLPATTESVLPAGMYAQPPATGELEGQSSGYGLRGMEIRLPEIRLSLPSVNFPRLIRHTRAAQMHVDSATAPFVPGVPAQFGMLSAGGLVPANALHAAPAQGIDKAPTQSVPPCAPPPSPACENLQGSRERQLLQELARRDAEIEAINRRFGRLEDLIGQLADRERRPSAIQPSSYEQPQDSEQLPPQSQTNRPAGAPGLVPLKRQPTVRDVEQQSTSPANVGHSRIVEEPPAASRAAPRFGNWSSSRKSSSPTEDTRQVRR